MTQAIERLLEHDTAGDPMTGLRWMRKTTAKLASQLRKLGITVSARTAHYPTGASKYNPIERRLFSQISKNWAGEPLDSYEKILKFIRTTTTSTGLKVTARLDRRHYPVGVRLRTSLHGSPQSA